MIDTPAWVQAAHEEVLASAKARQQNKRSKDAALVSMAARKRDPLGKFLRSKPAKRYIAEGREVVKVSVPLGLYEMLRVDAADAKLSIGRMMVVLAALGRPPWEKMREDFLTGGVDDAYVIPHLVKRILENAVNPAPVTSRRSLSVWHQQVEALARSAAPKKKQPKDATAAVLAGLGGGK